MCIMDWLEGIWGIEKFFILEFTKTNISKCLCTSILDTHLPPALHMGLKLIIFMLSTKSENNTKNIQSLFIHRQHTFSK